MKVTAHANINIALIKYWGKRDEKLILPYNSSLSLTLADYGTTTTIEFDKKFKKDEFVLDGKRYLEGDEYDRVVGQLDLIRKQAKFKSKAKIVSINKVETTAGLASSASGAAALTTSASKAAGLNLSSKNLSIIARQGSGSSTRSILGGFVEWTKGVKKDGNDSFAKQWFDENYWPQLRVLAVVVSFFEKKIKSRVGMKQTVATCPYYEYWLKTIDQDLVEIKKAIKAKDFVKMGEISEHNFLKLHALMMTTKPPIIYWLPKSVELIHLVQAWRDEGLSVYLTMDAGPQVKILCLQKDVKKIQARLKKISGIRKIIELKLGKGVEYLDKHLF